MVPRANYFGLASEAMQILMNQEGYLRKQFSESNTIPIWELLKLRVSQLNQCAFCIDMHSKDALSRGEAYERIIGLNAWRDMPLYSETERAVLDWAEFLTEGQPVDDVYYQAMVKALGEQTLVDLTIAVNAINSWNRVAKTFKPEVGCYQPQ